MESIVCLVNILLLIKALTGRRLEFENGAREALSGLSTLIRPRGTKIESLTNSIGLSTCKEEDLLAASVVMLSNVSKYIGTPNSSIQQFMKSNAHMDNLHSILLHFFPLKANTWCNDKHGSVCNCIVFWTVEEMTTNMLDRRMPGILKRLTDSLCLLPCHTCFINGCHGCNQEGQSVVSKILDKIGDKIRAGEPICICITMNDARHDDDWTNLLVRSFWSTYTERRMVY